MQDFVRDNNIELKRVKYKDIENEICYTQQRFKSISDFIEFCKLYGIKYQDFKEIELVEDE